MKTLRGAAIIIGGTIGAGFISGAELVRFFHTKYFVLPVLFSSFLFAALSAGALALGRKHGGYENTLKALFGRGAAFVKYGVALASFIPCAGMLAGLDALFPAASPLLSLAGLLISALVLTRGTKGISALNLLLVPLLLFFVFWGGRGEKSLGYPVAEAGLGGWGGAILYASMNALLLFPVLLDAGRDVPHPAAAALGAGTLIALSALTILGCIYREGAGALNAEMPFLYVMRGKLVFSVAVALAIFTSLAASLFPLLELAKGCEGKKKYAAQGGMLLAAFLFSRLGLKDIILYLYPAEGAFGILLASICILDEYLFEKHHKKVHSRGEKAEDGGGAHHKVELKDLPAVNDQIAETRL